MKPLVAYYRVSTREQGRSGLGLEAQREAIARFAETEGFELVAEFTDIETGKGADALDRRPQLAAALETARRHGKSCPVAVAKLDRLSRDVHFISGLMTSARPVRRCRARWTQRTAARQSITGARWASSMRKIDWLSVAHCGFTIWGHPQDVAVARSRV